MTHDIKYPEEIVQDEMLKNLERLQAKLRRREGKAKLSSKINVETSTDAPRDKVFFMKDGNLYSGDGSGEWERLNEDYKKEVDSEKQ